MFLAGVFLYLVLTEQLVEAMEEALLEQAVLLMAQQEAEEQGDI
jgi:hypothetical protein